MRVEITETGRVAHMQQETRPGGAVGFVRQEPRIG